MPSAAGPAVAVHGQQTLNADQHAGQATVDEVGAAGTLQRHQAQQDVLRTELQPVPDELVGVFEGGLVTILSTPIGTSTVSKKSRSTSMSGSAPGFAAMS